jgi:phage/plasmid-associated DNA primase
LIIQFDNVVKPHLRVLDLGSKIASAEKEQIVNWASKAITQLNEQRSFDLAPNDLEGGIARMNNNVRYFIETACTTHNLSWLKSLEKDELTQELTALKPTSLKYIYTKYSVFVKDMNCGAVVDEQEFIMRMRHLAAMFGFISVVGAAANRRIMVQYYGVNL